MAFIGVLLRWLVDSAYDWQRSLAFWPTQRRPVQHRRLPQGGCRLPLPGAERGAVHHCRSAVFRDGQHGDPRPDQGREKLPTPGRCSDSGGRRNRGYPSRGSWCPDGRSPPPWPRRVIGHPLRSRIEHRVSASPHRRPQSIRRPGRIITPAGKRIGGQRRPGVRIRPGMIEVEAPIAVVPQCVPPAAAAGPHEVHAAPARLRLRFLRAGAARHGRGHSAAARRNGRPRGSRCTALGGRRRGGPVAGAHDSRHSGPARPTLRDPAVHAEPRSVGVVAAGRPGALTRPTSVPVFLAAATFWRSGRVKARPRRPSRPGRRSIR